MAIDTAGRTVMFAAITVVIALLGLLLLGLNFMQGVALGAATAVLATMFAALTDHPGADRRVGQLHRRRAARVRRARRLPLLGHEAPLLAARARVALAPRSPARAQARRGRGLGALVARRPAPPVARGHHRAGRCSSRLALPATQMRLGSSDAGRRSARHDDAQGLRPDRRGLRRRHQRLVPARRRARQEGRQGGGRSRSPTRSSADKDFTFVAPPAISPDGDGGDDHRLPAHRPAGGRRPTDTLNRLRDDVVPAVERETGARVEVGGFTASNEDFSRVVAEQAAALRRRRRAVQRAAAAGRLPLGDHPDQGRGPEPAVDRRRAGLRDPGLPGGARRRACWASAPGRSTPSCRC